MRNDPWRTRVGLGCRMVLWTALGVWPIAARGDSVLASYNFGGGSSASSVSNPLVTAGAFTAGAFNGGTPSTYNVDISTSTYTAYIRSTASIDTTEAAAVTNDDSWGFTITPESGVQFRLTSLAFDYGASSDSTAFTAKFVVRSSLDNYTANLGLPVYLKTVSGIPLRFNSATIDLSSNPDFQNISGPVTLKFFEFDSETNSSKIARLDNVVLYGEEVPLPGIVCGGTVLLGLLGGWRKLGMSSASGRAAG